MQSVLSEIKKLRTGTPIAIDKHNSNRYRLVLGESNGTKTAYYFNIPIYNQKTRKMVDTRFSNKGNMVNATGSNTITTISQNILMENAEGSCVIELIQMPTFVSPHEVRSGNCILTPTSNGVVAKYGVDGIEGVGFVVSVGQPFLDIRANDRCFALMKEEFRPLVVFSCIGALDGTGNVIAPAKIEYHKLTENKYWITVFSTSPMAKYVLFEANLYENKLFQDTTVESMYPSTNNAFGSVGFIGKTSVYGEQWLYSRLDYSRMSEMMDKRVNKMIFHIPKLNQSDVELSAFRVTARFCSFGSNWDNKIASGELVSDSRVSSEYQSLDVTSLLVDSRTRTLVRSEGLILKPKTKEDVFSVIATGDSYYAPQIMEINYR